MNEFKYSNTNKRYYTLDYYYKEKYNCKICKISLNQGVTCPNIDGTKGTGGCIYCSNGSSDFAGDKRKPLKTQFKEVKEIMLNKWPTAKFIAYFQPNTNTYGALDKLIKNFEEVLTYKDVVGINISTRPDSITKECLDYLEDLNKRTDLTVELGLQTIKESTNQLINRCHSLKEFEDTVEELNKRNIKILVHIIDGLPYETKEDMLDTIRYLNKFNIWGIKIHMLNVIKNTKLEELYNKEKFHILTLNEYVDIIISQLELLREDIVVNRLTADAKKEDLIEPKWIMKKFVVLDEIDKEMVKRNSYQGIKRDY